MNMSFCRWVAAAPLCAAVALSCASPQPAPVLVERPAPPAVATEAPTAAPSAVAPRNVKDLGGFSSPGALCTLGPDAWDGALSLRDGGAAFATIRSTVVSLTLSARGEQRWAVASVDTKDVSFRGMAAPPPVFLTKPRTFAGFAIPNAATSLRWDEAPGAAKAVLVTFDTSDTFANPGSLKERVPCAELAIVARLYDARAFLHAEALEAEGTVGADVELRLSPGAPPVAKINAGKGAGVYVLRPGKVSSRVVLDIGNGYAFGWIGSDHINRRMRMGPRIDIRRPLLGFTARPSNPCDRELPLTAEVGDERAVIGSLKAHAAFKVGRADPETKLTGIVLDVEWLALATGATLWVPTSELEACSGTPS